MGAQSSQRPALSEYPSLDDLLARPPSAEQRQVMLLDLEAIARGEEMDLPWRRVCALLDRGLVEINHPVYAQGSRYSLSITDAGLRFMEQ